jgi:uncharacterized protein (TIGR01741 family)
MDTEKMEELYQQIGETLVEIIPEEWSKILLYAQVNEGSTSVYFYYYPMGKKEPEYCHDIHIKWDMPEDEYDRLEMKLFDLFNDLWNKFKTQKQEQWTNLTLTLESSGNIDINYDYTNVEDNDPYEDQVIWCYKNLGFMPDKSRKRDIQIIQEYLKKQR